MMLFANQLQWRDVNSLEERFAEIGSKVSRSLRDTERRVGFFRIGANPSEDSVRNERRYRRCYGAYATED